MSSTIAVASASDLYAALETASGGDTIVLESGYYGDVILAGHSFASNVTITSADPANTAVFNTIFMNNCTNITIDQVEIDFVPDVDTVVWDSALRIDNSSNITLSNSLIEGGLAAAGASPDIPAGEQGPNGIDGYPIGNGIFLFQSNDIVITGTEITMFHKGVSFDWTDGLSFTDNYIHDVRTSHFSGGYLENAEINDNHFSTSNPWKWGGLGDHGDIIHIYHRFGDTAPMDNITISGNFFEQGDGHALLGIYLDNNAYGQGFTNVTISDNILHNGNFQGIRFERVIGATIENNTFVPTTDVDGEEPGMVLTDGTRDLLIRNNVIGEPTGSSYTGALSSTMTFIDNVFVQAHDPMSENYVGDLFSRGLIADGDATDFYVIPGSAADGVGASATQLGATSGAPFGVFDANSGTGAQADTVTFDALTVFGASGAMDLSGATVHWDFGDGQSATGESVTHVYEVAATYDVVARVEFADGSVVTSEKSLLVQSPEALSLDFENGLGDQSDYVNEAMVTGSASVVSGSDGNALRLDADSYIEYDRSWELVNNEGFTVSVDFQKDAGAESPTGTLVSFIGAFGITTYEGKIAASIDTTESPAEYMGVTDASIEDGNWHNVTLTYSSETGTATLFLDGNAVDSRTGLEGLQSATAFQDFHVGGNNWSSSFTGLIDNVELIRYAKTAEEVQAAYLGIEPPVVETPPVPDPDPVVADPPDTESTTSDVVQDEPVVEPVIEERVINESLSPEEPVVEEAEPARIRTFAERFFARRSATEQEDAEGSGSADTGSGDGLTMLGRFAGRFSTRDESVSGPDFTSPEPTLTFRDRLFARTQQQAETTEQVQSEPVTETTEEALLSDPVFSLFSRLRVEETVPEEDNIDDDIELDALRAF